MTTRTTTQAEEQLKQYLLDRALEPLSDPRAAVVTALLTKVGPLNYMGLNYHLALLQHYGVIPRLWSYTKSILEVPLEATLMIGLLGEVGTLWKLQQCGILVRTNCEEGIQPCSAVDSHFYQVCVERTSGQIPGSPRANRIISLIKETLPKRSGNITMLKFANWATIARERHGLISRFSREELGLFTSWETDIESHALV